MKIVVPKAKIKEHFSNDTRDYTIAKITNKWIIIVCNQCASAKFDRKQGYGVGAFRNRQSMTPSKIVNLKEINDFAANYDGNVFDSGWKPQKHLPQIEKSPEEKEKEEIENIKREIEYRKTHFDIRIQKSIGYDYYQKVDKGFKDYTINISHNGSQYDSIHLTPEEMEKLQNKWKEFLNKGNEFDTSKNIS